MSKGRVGLGTIKALSITLLLIWWLLLIRTPPSEGLWRDVRCDLVPTGEFLRGYPRNCVEVFRLYPDPYMWFYEFVIEPITGVRQDW